MRPLSSCVHFSLALSRVRAAHHSAQGLMHESFWYTDPSVYTRSWFAMANSFVGEALLILLDEKPEWLLKL